MTGPSVGLVLYLDLHQVEVVWYVKNKETHAVSAQLTVMQYGNDINFPTPPVPGGCCLTSNLELDANIHIAWSNYFQSSVEFSQANVGVPHGILPKPVCSMTHALQFRLHYGLYIYYLPRFKNSESSYFEGIQKMMTVDGVRKYGTKVASYTNKFQGKVILSSIQGQGVVYNVIVTDPVANHSSAAYVPMVNFACTYDTTDHNQPSCTNILEPGFITMYVGLSILGFILCFSGHYYFKIEVFFFGGLTIGIPAFLIFSTSSNIFTDACIVLGFTFGGIGGGILFILWWLYGKVLPTMLIVAINFGYLFASCAFFIGPLGNMNVWSDNIAYGLTFTSAILLVPIFTIPFTRKLSLLATALWGSYLIMSLISYVSKSTLHLVVIYPLARTVFEDFNNNLIFLPYAMQDIIIIVLWVVLAIAGVITQHLLTRKDQRDFPECPAVLYAKRNIEFTPQEQQIPPIVDANERTPLLQDTR
ncbi:transmembrane 7 superfamily member 3-like isoform X2 [Anneissia japonica]|nr:transmembrane 7 superfamily member 3-like isoform X2 [Anneissia japonica]